MSDDDARATAKVWDADLSDVGRKLTLSELSALELMHVCALLQKLVVRQEDTVRYLSSLEGRLDRLEQYLVRLDPQRYPASADPTTTAALADRWNAP